MAFHTKFILFLLLLSFSFCSQKTTVNTILAEKTGGCGNFFVYKLNTTSDAAFTISGQLDALQLTKDFKEFDLKTFDERLLSVEYIKYDGPGIDYCDDVIEESEPKKVITWKAVKGKLKMKVNNDDPELRTISIVVEQVRLQNSKKKALNFYEIVFDQIAINWYPG